MLCAAAVAGCGGAGTGAATTAPTTNTPTTTAPAATAPEGSSSTAGPSPALAQACASYASTHQTARQVVESAAEPILAAGPAFFLINLRQTAVDAISAVPAAAGVFTELRDAIDDINQQATAALPPGADGTKTQVRVQPARLGAALDAVDKLCAGAR